MDYTKQLATQSALGKRSDYETHYNPELLFPVAREAKRLEIGINPSALPFFGYDLWHHYEVSWLNQNGKPIVATAKIFYDCTSPFIIESKSLKLYFNSFNNTQFESLETVTDTLKMDLQNSLQTEVYVEIVPLSKEQTMTIETFNGLCIDDLDTACDTYTVTPTFLSFENKQTEEVLYSNLLKSNCLVTGQPDWGSVQIHYKGKQICHEGLLKYIVSFRNHNEFHEQCIERIFNDILTYCQPDSLTVFGRYTRRGGLDINPFRSTENTAPELGNYRLCRQ